MSSSIFIEQVTTHQMIWSAITFCAVSVAGITVDRILIRWLKKLALKTKWEGDDILLDSLKYLTIWVGIASGIYSGTSILSFTPAIHNEIHHAFWIIICTLGTIYAGRVTSAFIRHISSQHTNLLPSSSILTNIAKVVIYSTGLLIILQYSGISITPLLTALGVGGLAVALALQTTLSNLFAGIQLLASKNLHTGDYVRLESGDEGYITDINWRSTTIHALQNLIIVIPNAKFSASIFKNYSLLEEEIAVLIDMSVAYNSDLKKVERVTIDVAAETLKLVSGGIPSFQPFIRFNSFGESGIGFTVILRAQEFVNNFLIKHEFIKAIHERYRLEKIEIPYPVRVIKIDK